MSTEEHHDEQHEPQKPTGDILIVKTLAVLFVLGIYTIILLKIIILK